MLGQDYLILACASHATWYSCKQAKIMWQRHRRTLLGQNTCMPRLPGHKMLLAQTFQGSFLCLHLCLQLCKLS